MTLEQVEKVYSKWLGDHETQRAGIGAGSSAIAVARLTAPLAATLVVAGLALSSICAAEVSQTAPTMQTSTPSV
jgi:hypothetical protein